VRSPHGLYPCYINLLLSHSEPPQYFHQMKTEKNPEFRPQFYENGNIFREYTGDATSGNLREYHRNGQLAIEKPMKNGLRHGICKQWNEQGTLLGEYEMNMGTGFETRWHSNGTLQFERYLIKEVFNGRLRTWLESGELNLETFVVDKEEISKPKYDKARLSNPALPVYESN
jgi:antitoxin component YwqK of YwqJK toxin-antitoxin module